MTAVPRLFTSVAGASGGGTTQAATLASLAAGDDVLVATFTTGAQTITGVSDGVNTYAKIGSVTSTPGTAELWAALSITASATPKTITATWSATAAFASLWVADMQFLVTASLLDANNTSTGTSTTMAGPTITSAAVRELQIALFVGAGKPITTFQTAGWMAWTTSAMHTNGFGVAALSEAAGTSNAVSWFQTSSSTYAVYAAALKTTAPSATPVMGTNGQLTVPGTTQFPVARKTTAVAPALPYPAVIGQVWPSSFGVSSP